MAPDDAGTAVAGVLSLLADPANDLFLSAASSWEIAIKYALGKLPLPEPPGRYVPRRMMASGGAVWRSSTPIACSRRAPDAPPVPFDRLLVAQAQIDKLTLVTVDPQFETYDIRIRPGR